MAALLKLIKKKQDAPASNDLNNATISAQKYSRKVEDVNNTEEKHVVKPKALGNNSKLSTTSNGRTELRTKRLMKEFLLISKSCEDKDSCFSAELVDDSLFEWNIKLFTVDPDSELHKDMQELNHPHVLLNLRFPDNFPFAPPFMRVVKPRIDGGFVLDGGAICMELLTPSGWSSAYTVEAIVMQFAALVVKGKGRIDKKSKSDFSRREAESSFKKLVKTHERYGWITPPKSEG